MRTKCFNVYQYSELSEQAKEKARDWYREVSSGDEWWQYVYEDAENVGIRIKGFDIERGNYCKGEFIAGGEETAHKIEKNHGPSCETYKTAKAYLAERDKIIANAPKDANGEFEDERELEDALDECEAEFLKSILDDYRIMLSEEYDYQNSDEVIEENITANEYEFDANGKRA